MKINEASVINNKVIDEMIAECLHPEVYEALLHIKQHSKPLELIVRDAYFKDCLHELTPPTLTNTQTKTEI